MSEDTTTEETIKPSEDDKKHEETVAYERFQKANEKAKEHAARATRLEKEMEDLKARLDEREQAGLPELERERKRAEQLEKRIAEAEQRAETTQAELVANQRKSLVLAAAAAQGFDDPSDAIRYPEIINLDEIEDAGEAERAVKRLAKAKPRLLKDTEPKQPQIGRVLENGQPAAKKEPASGSIDTSAEAELLARELKKFSAGWQTLS